MNPCTKMFDSYLKQSPWSNYEKQECKANAFQFQVEKFFTAACRTMFLCMYSKSHRTACC